MRFCKKKRADYSDVYTPREGAQTVAIENAASHEEFRSAEMICALARAQVPGIQLERVRQHCDWQVDERQLWIAEDR